MPRIIAFVTCFFWMSIHALAALAALIQGGNIASTLAPIVPVGLISSLGTVGGMAYAMAHGVVAAGFLWAFVTIMFEDDERGYNADDTLRTAYAGAILLATCSLLLFVGLPANNAVFAAMMEIAALGATLAAVQVEAWTMRFPEATMSGQVAQRMALGAAHNTMLDAISGARSGTSEGKA